jgi:phospholipase C
LKTARVSKHLRGIQLLVFASGSLLFAALLTACGGGANFSGTMTAPTVSITASATSVSAGGSSTLTVAATNATTVTISGSDGTSYTLSATGGTQSITPAATTTYTATASGIGGSTTATIKVTVTASAAPTIAISASPASITAGGTSTLTVTATNATTVTVTGTDNTTYTLNAAGGTQPVSPAATTTYTATATGAGGTVTATVVVTVGAAPVTTVTITANPTAITQGASSILTVVATNATAVKVTGSDNTTYGLSSTGGTQAVSPTTTTTYTATATGAGGPVTATAMVTVSANPAPSVTIAATPSSITAGGSSSLSVTATNAMTVTVAGSDGTSYTLGATGGAQSVTPSVTTTYTATATGPGGTGTAAATVTVTPNPNPTVTITASPTSIVSGNSSTLTVTATNATTVTITAPGGVSYSLSATGGTQAVSPTATTAYTATASGASGTTAATASTTVTVTATGSVKSIDHVIFMLQENHTFDNYFGMLNPYRQSQKTGSQAWNVGDNGMTYNVDGIDDILNTPNNEDDEGTTFPLFKFTSSCVDDESSAWLESYGDVNTYDFTDTRPILMDGFVHNAEGYAKNCVKSTTCSGSFSDTIGQRAMGYYDQDMLNYYYYMASQFALSDRWFSPVASKSIDNRIATFTGGTTQGLVKDPGGDDHLAQLNIETIFQELDAAKVSWKIYYTVTQGFCFDEDDCPTNSNSRYPATDFSALSYSYNFLRDNPTPGSTTTCPAPLQPSQVVGDTTNSFCIDPDHIAPLTTYYSDLQNGTLPSFAFIEAGYGRNDEHPGSGQSILAGQVEVAKVVNALMVSSSWADSVFFFSYDEGGGPYDHVPPVLGSSNSNTNTTTLGATPPDISAIAVNPDTTAQQPTMYFPCIPTTPGTPTTHCDLESGDPGATPGDAAADNGFAAQLGFRLPNMVISPFTLRHYVSHTPMDHTAVIKFVENRFIPGAHLTNRDAAQPNLLDFFDFNNVPWATPPTPPAPFTDNGASCTPSSFTQVVRRTNR